MYSPSSSIKNLSNEDSCTIRSSNVHSSNARPSNARKQYLSNYKNYRKSLSELENILKDTSSSQNNFPLNEFLERSHDQKLLQNANHLSSNSFSINSFSSTPKKVKGTVSSKENKVPLCEEKKKSLVNLNDEKCRTFVEEKKKIRGSSLKIDSQTIPEEPAQATDREMFKQAFFSHPTDLEHVFSETDHNPWKFQKECLTNSNYKSSQMSTENKDLFSSNINFATEDKSYFTDSNISNFSNAPFSYIFSEKTGKTDNNFESIPDSLMVSLNDNDANFVSIHDDDNTVKRRSIFEPNLKLPHQNYHYTSSNLENKKLENDGINGEKRNSDRNKKSAYSYSSPENANSNSTKNPEVAGMKIGDVAGYSSKSISKNKNEMTKSSDVNSDLFNLEQKKQNAESLSNQNNIEVIMKNRTKMDDLNALSSSCVFETMSADNASAFLRFLPPKNFVSVDTSSGYKSEKSNANNNIHNHFYLSSSYFDSFSTVAMPKISFNFENKRLKSMNRCCRPRKTRKGQSTIKSRRIGYRKRRNISLKYGGSQTIHIVPKEDKNRIFLSVPANLVNINLKDPKERVKVDKIDQTDKIDKRDFEDATPDAYKILLQTEKQLKLNQRLMQKLRLHSTGKASKDIVKLLTKSIRRCKRYINHQKNIMEASNNVNTLLSTTVMRLQKAVHMEKLLLEEPEYYTQIRFDSEENQKLKTIQTLFHQRNKIVDLVMNILSLTGTIVDRKNYEPECANTNFDKSTISMHQNIISPHNIRGKGNKSPRLKSPKFSLVRRENAVETRTRISSKSDELPFLVKSKSIKSTMNLENRWQNCKSQSDSIEKTKELKYSESNAHRLSSAREKVNVKGNAAVSNPSKQFTRQKSKSSITQPIWRPGGNVGVLGNTAGVPQKRRPLHQNIATDKILLPKKNTKSSTNKHFLEKETSSRTGTPRENRKASDCLKDTSSNSENNTFSKINDADVRDATKMDACNENKEFNTDSDKNTENNNNMSSENIESEVHEVNSSGTIISESHENNSSGTIKSEPQETNNTQNNESSVKNASQENRNPFQDLLTATSSNENLSRRNVSNTQFSKHHFALDHRPSFITFVNAGCTAKLSSNSIPPAKMASSKCCQASLESSTSSITSNDDSSCNDRDAKVTGQTETRNIHARSDDKNDRSESQKETFFSRNLSPQKSNKKSLNSHTLKSLKEFLCYQGINEDLLNKAERDIMLKHGISINDSLKRSITVAQMDTSQNVEPDEIRIQNYPSTNLMEKLQSLPEVDGDDNYSENNAQEDASVIATNNEKENIPQYNKATETIQHLEFAKDLEKQNKILQTDKSSEIVQKTKSTYTDFDYYLNSNKIDISTTTKKENNDIYCQTYSQSKKSKSSQTNSQRKELRNVFTETDKPTRNVSVTCLLNLKKEVSTDMSMEEKLHMNQIILKNKQDTKTQVEALKEKTVNTKTGVDLIDSVVMTEFVNPKTITNKAVTNKPATKDKEVYINIRNEDKFLQTKDENEDKTYCDKGTNKSSKTVEFSSKNEAIDSLQENSELSSKNDSDENALEFLEARQGTLTNDNNTISSTSLLLSVGSGSLYNELTSDKEDSENLDDKFDDVQNFDKYREDNKSESACKTTSICDDYLSSRTSLSSISLEVESYETERYDTQNLNETISKTIPEDVIVALQLAAERGRNLRTAIEIYRKDLLHGGNKNHENRNSNENYENYPVCEDVSHENAALYENNANNGSLHLTAKSEDSCIMLESSEFESTEDLSLAFNSTHENDSIFSRNGSFDDLRKTIHEESIDDDVLSGVKSLVRFMINVVDTDCSYENQSIDNSFVKCCKDESERTEITEMIRNASRFSIFLSIAYGSLCCLVFCGLMFSLKCDF